MNLRIPDDPLLFALRTGFSVTSDAAGQPRVCSSMPPRRYRPSKSAPRPPGLSPPSSTARRTEPARSVARIACGTQSPLTDRAQCLPANANVTVPLPAVAVEVKRLCCPRVPSGTWGDGTEPDAVDDLNADPTPERQFQVQATGVHEGGTVKWFDGRGKGRATPVGMGTLITNANVGPSARAPANGTIDLGKSREPDVPKKRKRERERKPFITLRPPPVAAGSALLLQVPARKPKRRRERGPPPPMRPNMIRDMNGTKLPKRLRPFFTLTGTWHQVD